MTININEDKFKIDSLLEFIQNRVDSIVELFNTNKKFILKNINKKEFMVDKICNNLYDSVIVSTEASNKILPLIKTIILNNSILKDDLFYYFSAGSNMILFMWDFLKRYIEEYLFFILDNEQFFDFNLYQKYLNFIINILNVLNEFFDIKIQSLNDEITQEEYNESYELLEDKFEEYEELFYIEYHEIEKSTKKDEFMSEIFNMEFFKDELK